MSTFSRVDKPFEYDSFEEARRAAVDSAATSGARLFPCVVFWQGGRTMISTSFPLLVATRQIKTDSSKKGESARSSTNRPIIPEHVNTIQRYLKTNREQYILPPLTLNVKEMPKLFIEKGNQSVRMGFLSIGDETSFYVTDGQHRLRAIEGVLEQDRELGRDGIAVMIVVEKDIAQIHQDFADAAQTKAIPASLLAVYNTREPVNKALYAIVENSKLLNGRIDETSQDQKIT